MKIVGIALLALVAALVACSSATPTPLSVIEVQRETVEVPVTVEVEVTREVEVVVTELVVRTAEVTRLFPVTVTSTPTPLFTPTITPTPSETPLPTGTPDAAATATAIKAIMLTSLRGNGFYLVNVDIAPGVWRSNGSGDDCYWETSTATGDIIDNHFGAAGGSAYISPNAFQVEFARCGSWEYLGPP